MPAYCTPDSPRSCRRRRLYVRTERRIRRWLEIHHVDGILGYRSRGLANHTNRWTHEQAAFRTARVKKLGSRGIDLLRVDAQFFERLPGAGRVEFAIARQAR